MDEKFVTSIQRIQLRDGISLAVRKWEDGNTSSKESSASPIIVILHGLGGHSGYYDYFGSLLTQADVLVFSYDRRGHGISDGPRGDLKNLEEDLEDLTEVIIWLQRKYPDKKIHFLGESWGCLYCLYYLAVKRVTISTVILLSPPVRLTLNFPRCIAPILGITFDIIKNVFFLRFNGKIGAPFPLELASRDYRFCEKLKTDNYTNFKMTMRYGVLALKLLNSVKIFASKIHNYTLIFHGESDLLLQKRGAIELYKMIPTSRKELVIVPEAYHTLYYDPKTPLVVETITSWIQRDAIV